jgi:hypothetical protein
MMLHALQSLRVDRTFDAAPRASSAAAMRAHLAGCAACRRRYQRRLIAEAALPDGAQRAGDRLWREIQRVAAAPRRTPRRWPLAVAAAVAASLVLVVGLVRRGPDPVARGGAGIAPPPALHLFQAVGGMATPAADRIHASDGLLFAYSNPGAAYSHLMVFAVDEARRVYWFYPPYQRHGDDPQAVPIEPGRSGVELAEEIHQPLEPGPLRLFALFLPRPERVLAVEAAVARAYGPGASVSEERPLGVPDARQESRLLEVAP